MEFTLGLFATITVLTASANLADAVVAVAIPLNTGLLVLLAFLTRQNGRKLDAAHITTANAAVAAAAAAEAAQDSARITKELGGIVRTTEAPTIKS